MTTGNVVSLRPMQKMDAELFDRLVREIMLKYLQRRGFNAEFSATALARAEEAAKPLRKWFDKIAVSVPADLTPEQLKMVSDNLGTMISDLQADVLKVVLVEVYLRTSIEMQARDHGLEIVPLKDV